MSKMRAAYDFLAGDDGLLDGLKDQVKGEKGAPGGDGINGQKGNLGAKGAPGDDGSVTQVVFAFGTNTSNNLPKSGTFPADWDSAGVPTTTIALKQGESALDTRTNTLWMFVPGTNTANWINAGTKATGPKGAVGLKGDGGDKGNVGDKGSAGTNGADAAKGQKGDTADKGEVGTTGEKGAKGEMGQTGQKGQKGSLGATGGTGTKGEKGVVGYNGTDGNKGTKGQQGTAGTSGAKGQKGVDAVTSAIPTSIVAFNGTGIVVDGVASPTVNLNIDEVRKTALGTYRLRFQSKLPSVNSVVMANASYPNRADCTVRTRWTATIEVRDSGGNLIDDDYITATVFHPNTGAGG
jgi:hypothetical protein